MKTRIIKTTFWEDENVLELSPEARGFYLYLLTNPKINIIGVYELPNPFISFQTGYSKEKIQTLKQELLEKGRASFDGAWVILPNALRHNNYLATPFNQSTAKKEIETIPDNVKQFIQSSFPNLFEQIYSTVWTSINTSLTVIINNKQQREGGVGGDWRGKSHSNYNQNQAQPLQADRMYYEVTDYKQATPEQRDRILNCCEYGAPANRPDWTPPANTPQKYLDLWKAIHENNN